MSRVHVIGLHMVLVPCLAAVALAERLIAVLNRVFPDRTVFGGSGVESGIRDALAQLLGGALEF